MKVVLSTLVASGLLCSSALSAKTLDNEDIKQVIQFLTSKQLLINSKDNLSVPLSYYVGTGDDLVKYFGDYICQASNTCSVTDSLYSSPYAILGQGLPPQSGSTQQIDSAQAQLERTDMQYGADIYDAATWQIALALAANKGYLDTTQASTLVNNQTMRISNTNNRATDKLFQYGYQTAISDPSKAFAFRMVATDFHNKDPFYGTGYQNNVTWDFDADEIAKNDPDGHDASFFEYVTTWSDWKPITGENAWAMLVGPLQSEYLLTKGKVGADSAAVKNAINTLYAFSVMQTGVGAFYYAPGGSQGNQGPIARGEISLENNFSVLGGLQVMKGILQTTSQTDDVKQALATIDVMLNGGKTVNGYQTLGILSFLYNGAYNTKTGVFYTSGTAVTPDSQSDWVPDTSSDGAALAVDINTWGIAALGPETIDKWYGAGTALKIWQTVRESGGYFNNGEFWGVGYTLKNHGGANPDNIMSTEWTAGAVNAVSSLIDFYSKQGQDVSALKQDLSSMQQGIEHLRSDKYLASGFEQSTPAANFVQVPSEAGLAYLYASKRFAIPFGWNANTLASTTSNAWVIMNYFNFNPFQYQGSLSGQNYVTPAKVDIS